MVRLTVLPFPDVLTGEQAPWARRVSGITIMEEAKARSNGSKMEPPKLGASRATSVGVPQGRRSVIPKGTATIASRP